MCVIRFSFGWGIGRFIHTQACISPGGLVCRRRVVSKGASNSRPGSISVLFFILETRETISLCGEACAGKPVRESVCGGCGEVETA